MRFNDFPNQNPWDFFIFWKIGKKMRFNDFEKSKSGHFLFFGKIGKKYVIQ